MLPEDVLLRTKDVSDSDGVDMNQSTEIRRPPGDRWSYKGKKGQSFLSLHVIALIKVFVCR